MQWLSRAPSGRLCHGFTPSRLSFSALIGFLVLTHSRALSLTLVMNSAALWGSSGAAGWGRDGKNNPLPDRLIVGGLGGDSLQSLEQQLAELGSEQQAEW